DILMDRVWQLESETFHGTPGFVFAPITEIVWPDDDPTALHPVIQRRLGNVRTDLDHFSDLEISGLVQHGYCVAREVCRSRPDLFGEGLPKDSVDSVLVIRSNPGLAHVSTGRSVWS